MKLIEIIPRKAIIHDLKATDKKGAITELVQAMKKAHSGERFSISGLVEAILKREKLGTTGMGGGVAVPHANDSPDVRDDDALFQMPFCEAKRRHVDEFERRYLTKMLRLTDGNVNQAAKLAGKNRRAFFELMRKHGIDREQFAADRNSP